MSGAVPSGVGVGLRGPHVDGLLASARQLDFVEVVPENYVGRGGRDRRTLLASRARWPMLVHGVSVSLGGPDPLDRAYLAGLRELLDQLEVPIYTDHLCFTAVSGWQSHELLPLPRTFEAARYAAARIRCVSELLDRPVAVENVTQYATMPGSDLSRPAFARAVCEEADCGLLLDVNNLYVDAINDGVSPEAELAEMPLDRVVQLHVAGHERYGGRLVDTHGAATCPEVVALARSVVAWCAARGRAVPVLLERDAHLPAVDALLDEADAIRAATSPVRADARGAA